MEFPRPETGMGSLSLLQGIFPAQGSNPGLPGLQAGSLPDEPQRKPKNTGVGSVSLFQQIFPTQESDQSLLHCRRILYQLSYQGCDAKPSFPDSPLSTTEDTCTSYLFWTESRWHLTPLAWLPISYLLDCLPYVHPLKSYSSFNVHLQCLLLKGPSSARPVQGTVPFSGALIINTLSPMG